RTLVLFPGLAACTVVGASVGLLGTSRASAQGLAWPQRPVRLIVPYAPGGTPDFIARTLGHRLQEQVGQTVVIENRAGAGGNIGTEAIARATPDAHTIGIGAVSPLAINVTVYGARMPFDPTRDLAPITTIATNALVLLVHPSMPAKRFEDLVRIARVKPGYLNYGHAGSGTSNHLIGEMINQTLALKITPVAFKGAVFSMSSTIAGEIEMSWGQVPSAFTHLQGRRLRAIAVSGEKRTPTLPDVPTLGESGLPGFSVQSWYGIVGPAALPRDLIARLNAETLRALAHPGVRERLNEHGVETLGSTPEEFAAFIRAEIVKWERAVKLSGARVE
ncbi:MAG: tripartite tricarboxylate transporter substrate binding protein, partial [Proteobacteria bacterium]|nr:tripartite tricarboxylate transporter substrate binding protein [Burkholderiales bacterium]